MARLGPGGGEMSLWDCRKRFAVVKKASKPSSELGWSGWACSVKRRVVERCWWRASFPADCWGDGCLQVQVFIPGSESRTVVSAEKIPALQMDHRVEHGSHHWQDGLKVSLFSWASLVPTLNLVALFLILLISLQIVPCESTAQGKLNFFGSQFSVFWDKMGERIWKWRFLSQEVERKKSSPLCLGVCG